MKRRYFGIGLVVVSLAAVAAYGSVQLRRALVVGSGSDAGAPRAAVVTSQVSGAAVVTDQVIGEAAQAQSNVPATFGQLFRDGDVPKGYTLTATLNGQPVPLQVDAKATNPDGSLRHAVLTIRIPSIASGQSEPLVLATAPGSSGGAAVSLVSLLQTQYDTVATFTIGGAKYSVHARPLLAAAWSQGSCEPWGTTCDTWLSGPLVSAWVVHAPPTDSHGVVNPNIEVYFAVRAYAASPGGPIAYVRTDVIVENSSAFAQQAKVQYTAMLQSGTASYQSVALTQYPYTRWHEALWWNGQQARAYVQQDTQYLQSTHAIPRYMDFQPTETYLASLTQACAPLQICDQEQYMGAEGYQDGIGPLPRWTATYVIDPDVRAYRNMLANTDAIGAYSVHYRDAATGWPVSIQEHPYVTVNLNGYGGPTGPWAKDRLGANCAGIPAGTLYPGNCANPDVYDTAHQPDVAFVPYMVTGSYYYMSELAFDASYDEIWSAPPAREYSKGLIGNHAQGQPRGIAWTLRNVANAAYLLPDAYPLKAEFTTDVNNTLGWFNTNFTDNPNSNDFGVPQPFYDDSAGPYMRMSAFMHAFLVWSVQHAADLGFGQAAPFVNWLGQYETHVMTAWQQDPTAMCWTLAESYDLPVATEVHGGEIGQWLSWAQAYKLEWPSLQGLACNSPAFVAALSATKPPDASYGPYQAGQMFDYAYTAGGFPANLEIALAALVNAGAPNAQDAWNIFMARSVQPAGDGPTGTYRNEPQFSLLPYSATNKPIIAMYARFNPSLPGQQTVIFWDASAATSCTAPWTSSTATMGSVQVDTPQVYSITCSGPYGSTNASVTVAAPGTQPSQVPSSGSAPPPGSGNPPVTSAPVAPPGNGNAPSSGAQFELALSESRVTIAHGASLAIGVTGHGAPAGTRLSLAGSWQLQEGTPSPHKISYAFNSNTLGSGDDAVTINVGPDISWGLYDLRLVATSPSGTVVTAPLTVSVPLGSPPTVGHGATFSNDTAYQLPPSAHVFSPVTVAGVPSSALDQAIQVHVDIDHNKSGDLELALLGPNGWWATYLKQQDFKTMGGLDKTYTVNAKGAGSANGKWTLRVVDTPWGGSPDSGALKAWSITFAGATVVPPSPPTPVTPPPANSGNPPPSRAPQPPTSGNPAPSPSAPPPDSGNPPPPAPSGNPPAIAPAPVGVLPGPADPQGPVSAACAALQTCTLQIQREGPYVDPGAVGGRGWTSAEYARLGDGQNCILFMLGGTTNGAQDNSVRCLDPSTGAFSFVLPNTEYSNQQSNPPSYWVLGNGIKQRDNMLMLNVPGYGVLVYGGAYGNIAGQADWNGFFDYHLGKWTFQSNENDIYNLFIPQESAPGQTLNFFTWDPPTPWGGGDRWLVNWSGMNPATAWSTELNVGFVYGGTMNGSPSPAITLVYPRKDGRFDLEAIAPPPGTLACTQFRNSAVAVGSWVYVVGGDCAGTTFDWRSGVNSTRTFRRFNLITHVWQQLAPLPAQRYEPQVTYDSRSGYIVVYGGTGGSASNEVPGGGDPNVAAGSNSVYLWNVATGGPWVDATVLARMPGITQPAGAYDPTSGWNCYRPGHLVFDADGSAAPSGGAAGSSVYCMRLEFVPKQ